MVNVSLWNVKDGLHEHPDGEIGENPDGVALSVPGASVGLGDAPECALSACIASSRWL